MTRIKFNRYLFISYVEEKRKGGYIDDIARLLFLINPNVDINIITRYWNKETFGRSLFTHLFITNLKETSNTKGIYFNVELTNEKGEVWQN
jgi:hypothetical protein